jgi:hypothetical protein
VIPSAVADPFGASQFQTGLVAGAVASLGALVLPRAGSVFVVVAGTVAVAIVSGIPTSLITALVVLGLGGLVAMMIRHRAITAVASLPGALLIARAIGGEPRDWVRPIVIATVVIGSWRLRAFDKAHPRLGVPFAVVSLGGLYATVPDTENVMAVLGAALAVALIGGGRGVRLGSLGGPALVGLFGWLAAVEGIGRPASIVGGLGCLAVLIVGPTARAADQPRARAELVAMHFAAVFVCARVAGLRQSVPVAALICAGTLTATGVLSAVVARARPRT